MSTLDSIAVVQSDRAPNGFQLTFTTPRTPSEVADFNVLVAAQLQSGQRIIITASVGTSMQVLMDGIITRVQMDPPGAQSEARISVIGEDISVMMDMHEYSLEYPYMPDSVIAETILGEWGSLGITPEVTFSASDAISLFYIYQQVGTDRAYLNQLAAQNAYVFCIRPGPVVGQSRGYWGPPLRTETPQPVLTVDSSGFGSVISLSASFDSTAPTMIYGLVQDTLTGLPLPAMAIASTRPGTLAAYPQLSDDPSISGLLSGALSAGLGAVSAIGSAVGGVVSLVSSSAGSAISSGVNAVTSGIGDITGVSPSNSFAMQPLRLFDHQGLNILQAEARAQALLNASTDQVVTLTGRLDALRYGSILIAPGVVGLRGAGNRFDGYYYVQKVTHSISRGAYIQEFAMAREGLGSTIATVPLTQVTAGGTP